MDWKALGIVIRGMREAKGLSTKELGRRVGVTDKQIEHIEAGRRGTPLKRLTRIAEALGVEAEVRLVPTAVEADDEAIALLMALAGILPRVPRDRRGSLVEQVRIWDADYPLGKTGGTT